MAERRPDLSRVVVPLPAGGPRIPEQRPSRSWALRDRNLPRLAARVEVPGYRRDQLRTGVVHLGVGSFHRAHQGVYFDDLARLGLTRWGVTGVGLRSTAMQEALPPQDLLYTVLEQGADGTRARVVGALRRYHHAPQDPEAVLAALARRRTALVTLTLTGDGYPVDPATGGVVAPELQHDLDHPEDPRTAFGFLVAALDRRRQQDGPGLTVLSCDNRADAAAASRAAVRVLAERRDPGLARWVEQHVTFPDAMVDRITPATGDGHRRLLAEEFGLRDRWPVVTEPFTQWVVEDAFAGHRPPLDQVGVQFVTDVGPHKRAKTRLLNGTHCALGLLGVLAGYDDTGEAMADPLLRAYVAALMADEVAPLLPPVPGLDLARYQQTLLTRFANPVLVDPLTRLAGRASTKVPAYLLPSLREAADRGRPHALLTLAVAGWLHGLRQPGGLGLTDGRGVQLQRLAAGGGDDPRPVLGAVDVFGDLGHRADVVGTLRRQLTTLGAQGWRAALAQALALTT
ncbi:fructuronate reductase [Friedmanniella luteola]|uniref:Mannitol-1-phosphate 5-dehydrogenase n=1 Tax=Friedmanniella luteola TaxID=546871 RepID=A0A1H1TTI4_9ACTN|nr:mannitol dehydrogenase family protein [Friedmanniella luteola]SDS63510.1 fructuronate reductase [Friedmanniella luteola]